VNVSRIEVTKVPTPDMPATGLGGSVNLISRSGFENRHAVLSYEAYTLLNSNNGFTFRGGHRNQTDSVSPRFVHPSLEVSYLKPINKSFAITAGFSSTWRMKTHSADSRDEIPTWNLIDGIQRDSVWQAPIQLYKSGSGQLGAEWKISPSDTLSTNLQYREFSMEVHRSRLQVNYGTGVVGNAKFSQGAATGVGVATQGTGSEYEHKTNNRQAALKFRHAGSIWRFDASGSYSLANYAKSDVDDGYFFTVPATIQNLVIRGDGIPDSGGVPTKYSAVSRTGAPVDVYDGANYSIDTATSNQIDNDTEKVSARMDLARDLPTRLPVTVKIGTSIDRTARDVRTYSKTWNFRPNGSSDVTARLARNFDVFDDAFLAVAPKVYGVPLRDISMRKTYNLFLEHPTWFVLDDAAAYQNFVTNSREFQETVTAGYARADARLLNNRLWLVGGLRFERTDVSGRGPLDDINAQYQRNANGTFVRNAAGQRVLITNDALALRKLRYKERAAYAESDYHGFYPSLNASFNLGDHFVLRGAYARTLGRPDTSLITPGTTISDPDVASPTITVNNPALVPWTADNYDLSIESYNFMGGFGSIGVFQKNIKDFFGSVRTRVTPDLLATYGIQDDGSYSNYDLVTQNNAGDAKITGVEFNYRQSLTFLPAWASGFQVFVNATKLQLSGSTTADFTGFNPSKLAGGVNFIRARYFIKLNYSYQGETRRGAVAASAANGIPAGTYNYQGKRARLGISAQYSLAKSLSVYASIMDLGGFELLNRQYAPSTPEYARGNRIQELGYYTTIGIKGSF
jgi:TonB-dependent receptor